MGRPPAHVPTFAKGELEGPGLWVMTLKPLAQRTAPAHGGRSAPMTWWARGHLGDRRCRLYVWSRTTSTLCERIIEFPLIHYHCLSHLLEMGAISRARGIAGDDGSDGLDEGSAMDVWDIEEA
jgi:hypothetical protein